MNVLQLNNGLKDFLINQIDVLSADTPLISVFKPIIVRVLDKNFSKVVKTLDMIADEKGNIDIENIIDEMSESLLNTKTFNISTSYIGDIEVGEGSIKFNIPFTDKRLVLDRNDLASFKEMLVNKYCR